MNTMKHFVTGEGGTTSLLATALDPAGKHPGREAFRAQFTSMIGLPLSSIGPVLVKLEYMAIDLVMIWDDWVVLLENKVSGAAITHNQLNRYYNATVRELENGKFAGRSSMGKAHICVVFVTPTKGTGVQEFKSLELVDSGRNKDRKVHLSWDTGLLKALQASFKEGPSDDALTRLVCDGCTMTADILKYHEREGPKTVKNAKRIAIEDFMKDVRERLRKLMRLERDLKLTRWRSPRLEQVYGHIEGDNANVYFGILPDKTNVTTSKDAILDCMLELKIARKAPESYRKTFELISRDEWATMLGVKTKDIDIDGARHAVILSGLWSGSRDELLDKSALAFCRALRTFRPFMR